MTDALLTVTIPGHRLTSFFGTVDKLNRKAQKLGVEPIAYTVESTEPAVVLRTTYTDGSADLRYVPVTSADLVRTAIMTAPIMPSDLAPVVFSCENIGATTLHRVRIDGPEPYIEGSRFVASIDHDPEGNVVNKVLESPNVVVSEWTTARADCDHCKLNRQRLKTYLLEDEVGKVIQLGSTCIQDYFPGIAAQSIAKLAELYVSLQLAADTDDWGDSGSRSSRFGWLRDDVIEYAVAAVREYGWTSKSAAAKNPALVPTATIVAGALARDPDAKPVVVTPEDTETAKAVLEWADELDPGPADDYLWNLTSAMRREVTPVRLLGLVCSAVGTWQREQQREDAPKVPVPMGRYEVEGTVVSMRSQEGYVGGTVWKMLVKVETPEGEYRLWGSIPSAIEYDVRSAGPGAKVAFTAAVERSDDDESFGFYRRPTKARMLEVAA